MRTPRAAKYSDLRSHVFVYRQELFVASCYQVLFSRRPRARVSGTLSCRCRKKIVVLTNLKVGGPEVKSSPATGGCTGDPSLSPGV